MTEEFATVTHVTTLYACPSCGACVRGDDIQHHRDWHKTLGKRVAAAGSPFGSVFGAGDPL